MTQTLTNQLRELWNDEAGVATVEYAVLTMVVALASMQGWVGLRGTLSGVLDDLAVRLTH